MRYPWPSENSIECKLRDILHDIGLTGRKGQKRFKSDLNRVRILHQKGNCNIEIAAELYHKRKNHENYVTLSMYEKYINIMVEYLGLKPNHIYQKVKSFLDGELSKYREI